MAHYFQYNVITTNQSADAVINEERDHLADRELARQLQGQQPLTDDDYALCDAVDARVRAAANAQGIVTCDIRLQVDDVTTPPLSEEG